MDIEPLLKKLEALSPQFGRAQADIEAMVSRGRSNDFKGVMQNARLVLEMLLRAMVANELKQTPGKAMLDELITKFRQQANHGIVPTNVLAHMGTVQAWGNLSAHDHAATLTDEGVKVGADEVVASLNSMVAILTWYAGKYPSTQNPGMGVVSVAKRGEPVEPPGAPTVKTANAGKPAPLPATTERLPPVSQTPRKGPPVAAIVGVAVGLVMVGGGYVAMTRGETAKKDPVHEAQPPPVVKPSGLGFAALDAKYLQWEEPVPPASCRDEQGASALAGIATDPVQLRALARKSAEANYLLARALYDQKEPGGEALTAATGCAGFAAAHNLAGKFAIAEKKLPEAEASFRAALDAAPNYQKARFNLALLLLKTQKVSEGVAELKTITAAEPKNADAFFFLGVALDGQGQKDDAKKEFCVAAGLGHPDAKARCP